MCHSRSHAYSHVYHSYCYSITCHSYSHAYYITCHSFSDAYSLAFHSFRLVDSLTCHSFCHAYSRRMSFTQSCTHSQTLTVVIPSHRRILPPFLPTVPPPPSSSFMQGNPSIYPQGSPHSPLPCCAPAVLACLIFSVSLSRDSGLVFLCRFLGVVCVLFACVA